MSRPVPVGDPEGVFSIEGPPRIDVVRQRMRVGETEQCWHLVTAQRGAPGAVIVGVQEGRLALGRHWRWSTGDSRWEFPRGFGEPDETPTATGAREFYEELGLQALSVRDIGVFWPDSGLLGNSVHVIEVVPDVSAGRPGDGEFEHVVWLTPSEVERLIASGELTDGMTLAAFQIWRLRG